MATLLQTPPPPSSSCRAPSEVHQSLPVAIAMKLVTGFLVISPIVGLSVVLPLMWGNIVHLRDLVIALIVDGARAGELRDDVAPAELAAYCLHALTAAGSLRTQAAVRRLVSVTLAGLRANPPISPAQPA